MIRTATHYVPSKSLSPVKTLQAWWSVKRQRDDLSDLDSAMLRDIGITPSQAQAEAARPFWDAPDHWSK